MNKMANRAILAAVLSVTGAAQAQSVWSGAAGNWNSTVSPGWTTGGVPNAIDATADAQALGGTLTVNGNFTLGTLIQSGSTGRSINATGTNGLTFDVTAGNALWDMRGGLTGTGTSASAGHSTNITLNDNLEVRGLVSTGSSQPTFTGLISGNGQLQLTNVATTPVAGGIRVDLRNGSNSYAGGTLVGAGTALRINASGAAGTGAITLASSTAAGLNSLDFRNDVVTTQVHANNIDFGNRVSGGTSVLNLSGGMNVTLNGVLSGTMGNTGRVSLNGSTLILGGTAANTWTGQFRSDTHGTIITAKADALDNGFDMRSQVAGSTTALLVGVTDTIPGQISFNGNNSGAGFAYFGQLGLANGNNGTVTLSNANKINLANVYGGVGGTSTAPVGPSLNLHSGNGTGTLVVTTEIGQNSDARSISITGTGTVNLNRATGNTYTGTTTVSGGTLLANNTSSSATGTGAVNVNAGGTLGGTGFITTSSNNGVTVNAGGKLSPGASAGELTLALGSGSLNISGAVTATNSQSMVFELGAINPVNVTSATATSDVITLSAAATTLNIGAGLLEFDDFAFAALPGLQVGTYTLFDTGAAIVGSLGSNLSGALGGFNGTLSLANGDQDVVLTVTSAAVPEPTSLGLLALASLTALRRRRGR